MSQAGVHEQVMASIAHGAEYIMRCHTPQNTSTQQAFEFVVQIGDPPDYVIDATQGIGSWGPPSDMPENRWEGHLLHYSGCCIAQVSHWQIYHTTGSGEQRELRNK